MASCHYRACTVMTTNIRKKYDYEAHLSIRGSQTWFEGSDDHVQGVGGADLHANFAPHTTAVALKLLASASCLYPHYIHAMKNYHN